MGSIYQASHILGKLPKVCEQEAAAMRGGRDKENDKDAATGAIQLSSPILKSHPVVGLVNSVA